MFWNGFEFNKVLMALLPHRKHAQLQRDQKTQRDRMEEIERKRGEIVQFQKQCG